MTNEELVNALRFCADADSGSGCAGCTVDDWEDCCGRLLRDAADALEAADKKIADCVAAIDALDDSNDAYIKANERFKKRIAELEKDIIYWRTYAAEIER